MPGAIGCRRPLTSIAIPQSLDQRAGVVDEREALPTGVERTCVVADRTRGHVVRQYRVHVRAHSNRLSTAKNRAGGDHEAHTLDERPARDVFWRKGVVRQLDKLERILTRRRVVVDL